MLPPLRPALLAPALLRLALALAVLLEAVLRVALLGLAERVAGAAVAFLALEDATAERFTVGSLLRTSLDFI